MSIKWHKSTCPYCGFGCGLEVGVARGKVVEVRGMKDHPTNNGATCSLAHLLPGMRLVANYEHRQEIADFWGIPVEKIKPVPGLSIMEVIKGLHSGDVRALWVTTTYPAASMPNSQWVKQALQKAELLVVQDIFHPTETTQLADVVLAGAQWCEKTGTFISSERRIELVEAIIKPPGEAKPDAEIFRLIARALGLVNYLTNTAYNIHSKQPEYKFTAVKISGPRA